MANEPHLFTIDGVSFALGLFWQPLGGSTPAERSKEVRALAEELSFDLSVIRNSSMHSVGFAKSGDLKAGVFSAGAVVSKTMEVEEKVRDFIFVSALPDGSWMYVAQRDGAILSDGDLAFASEDAARTRLLEHMSLGDWPKVIAPAIWGVGGATERSFEDIIPRGKGGKIKIHKWWRLVPVGRGRAAMTLHAGKIAVACAVVAVVVGGSVFYKKWKAEKEAKAATVVVDAAGTPLPPEHPWKSQPLARDMMAACMTAVSSQQLFPGNWSVQGVECSGGNLVVSWTPRPGGWIRHLKEVEPAAQVALDGSAASISVGLPQLPLGQDEPAPTENERLVAMYSTAQTYGVPFVATAAPAAPVLPGQTVSATAPGWKEIGWKVDGVVLPEAVIAALDGPGFRMKTMRAKWQDGRFVWTMEGIQYVQP